MQAATRKIRSPLKWHGGKSYLARRIIDLFSYHETYVEPFFGGGSILLNKPTAILEVAGDLDKDLIEFWVTLRDRGEEIEQRLHELPYAEETFLAAKGFTSLNGQVDSIEKAVQFLVRNRMSRGGLGKDFAWSERLRGGQPGDLNAWMTFLEELPTIRDCVNKVEFYLCDATELIRYYDGPGVLFYLDPPYLHETRTHTKAYSYEMTKLEHERLLSLITGLQGKVFLSGYPSFLYDRYLADWDCWTFDMPNHSGQGEVKERRLECVWEKPD